MSLTTETLRRTRKHTGYEALAIQEIQLLETFYSNHVETVNNNSAIDSLIQSSLESENEYLRLKWIPYEEITNIKSRMLLSLGSSEECTPNKNLILLK